MSARLTASRNWPAPAKINLFLHVLGRRADGYHHLQTVFQFLDLADTLDFEWQQPPDIQLTHPLAGVPPEQDLVVRAARALQIAAGYAHGARISVNKRLPVGGGIGGGSSDAATALVALNELWGTHLATEKLAEIGVQLGADVPIFLYGQAAFAEGVGERLQAVQPPAPWYVLVKPDCTVSTAAVFNAPDLTRNTPPLTIRALAWGNDPLAVGQNDCETVTRRHFEPVAKALNWLHAQTHPARVRMTGTGACVYAVCADEDEARMLADKVPGPWLGYAVKGLNRSPLLNRLERAHAGRKMAENIE